MKAATTHLILVLSTTYSSVLRVISKRKSKLSSTASFPKPRPRRKLTRVSEAEKLKFAGNKDQYIFNSELSRTLDEVSNLLATKKTENAEEKLGELSKSLKRR